MTAYVWTCRCCGEQVTSDPRSWSSLESAHRLGHSLQDRLDRVLELLIAIGPAVGVAVPRDNLYGTSTGAAT